MATSISYGIMDNSKELGRMTIGVTPPAGTDYASVLATQGDIALHIAALSLGVLNTQSMNVNDKLSSAIATDVNANREIGVRFVGVDEDGHEASFTIPAPDLAKFPFATLQTDVVNWPYASPHADVTAFVVDLEAAWYDNITGKALELARIEKVGRNN